MIVLISVLSFIFDNSLLYIFFQTMFEKKKKRLQSILYFICLYNS